MRRSEKHQRDGAQESDREIRRRARRGHSAEEKFRSGFVRILLPMIDECQSVGFRYYSPPIREYPLDNFGHWTAFLDRVLHGSLGGLLLINELRARVFRTEHFRI